MMYFDAEVASVRNVERSMRVLEPTSSVRRLDGGSPRCSRRWLRMLRGAFRPRRCFLAVVGAAVWAVGAGVGAAGGGL